MPDQFTRFGSSPTFLSTSEKFKIAMEAPPYSVLYFKFYHRFFVVKPTFPLAQDLRQLRCQTLAALLPQFLWHAVERLSDAASNGGEGVAVTAEGHRRAQRVFKICAFQKCNNSLRYGFLAALYMMVSGANFIAGSAEVVAELALRIRFDLRFVVTRAGEKDGRGSSLRAP